MFVNVHGNIRVYTCRHQHKCLKTEIVFAQNAHICICILKYLLMDPFLSFIT